MKTIGDLNKKVSYRFTKAMYFLFSFVILSFTVKYYYENNIYYPMDNSQTRITCNNTGEHVDIKKSVYNIELNLSEAQKNIIAKEICGITDKKITEVYNEYHDAFLSSNNVFQASKGKMIEKLNILIFSGYVIGTLLGLLIITEVLRRVGYYILLGSLKPEK